MRSHKHRSVMLYMDKCRQRMNTSWQMRYTKAGILRKIYSATCTSFFSTAQDLHLFWLCRHRSFLLKGLQAVATLSLEKKVAQDPPKKYLTIAKTGILKQVMQVSVRYGFPCQIPIPFLKSVSNTQPQNVLKWNLTLSREAEHRTICRVVLNLLKQATFLTLLCILSKVQEQKIEVWFNFCADLTWPDPRCICRQNATKHG